MSTVSPLNAPVNVNICSTSGTIFSNPSGSGGSGGTSLTFVNLGTGGGRIYAQTIGGVVQLRRIQGLGNVQLAEDPNNVNLSVPDLAFNATAPVKRAIPGLQ